ncbi:hypothetical protein LENED_010638 [Lentinula edodes]|uniref:Uncharacterized protein n=1 Tax=Lentinula edodes TaxID=5353 RepID=A0A1Q3EN92_LENED|nr:hypothetical protein LENED_010638 [Lentinula edodes]
MFSTPALLYSLIWAFAHPFVAKIKIGFLTGVKHFRNRKEGRKLGAETQNLLTARRGTQNGFSASYSDEHLRGNRLGEAVQLLKRALSKYRYREFARQTMYAS